MSIKPKIIITDVTSSSAYYVKVQSLFTDDGFDVYFENDPSELENLLSSINELPELIVFGEGFDFNEYLEFFNLKQSELDLKYVPMICLNTSHPRIKHDPALYIDAPVAPEELVRIGKAHIKNRPGRLMTTSLNSLSIFVRSEKY